jgi:hypothetical protein
MLEIAVVRQVESMEYGVRCVPFDTAARPVAMSNWKSGA